MSERLAKPIKYIGIGALGACALVGPGMLFGHLVSDSNIKRDKAAIHELKEKVADENRTDTTQDESQIAQLQQDIDKNGSTNNMLLGGVVQLPLDAIVGLAFVLTQAERIEAKKSMTEPVGSDH